MCGEASRGSLKLVIFDNEHKRLAGTGLKFFDNRLEKRESTQAPGSGFFGNGMDKFTQAPG